MSQEFETQILDIDVEEIKNKLRTLNAKEEPEIFQKRWVFDIQCLDAKIPSTGEWLRLRQSGDKSFITYKNRRGPGLDQTEEIEVEVSDFDKTAKIFSKINSFTGKYYQENKRIKFTLNNIEFTIDTWPMIPPLLEIEATSPKKIKEGLKLLDLEKKDVGHIGTLQIYKRYNIDLHDYPELKFNNADHTENC